jgi:hypothetical protein
MNILSFFAKVHSEKTSSMLRKYTESLISNIEKRFSDSLEILEAFDIFNPFSVPERETLEFTVYFLAMHLTLECFDILLPERQDEEKIH